jgi:hypothetical protein
VPKHDNKEVESLTTTKIKKVHRRQRRKRKLRYLRRRLQRTTDPGIPAYVGG